MKKLMAIFCVFTLLFSQTMVYAKTAPSKESRTRLTYLDKEKTFWYFGCSIIKEDRSVVRKLVKFDPSYTGELASEAQTIKPIFTWKVAGYTCDPICEEHEELVSAGVISAHPPLEESLGFIYLNEEKTLAKFDCKIMERNDSIAREYTGSISGYTGEYASEGKTIKPKFTWKAVSYTCDPICEEHEELVSAGVISYK